MLAKASIHVLGQLGAATGKQRPVGHLCLDARRREHDRG
jgi:hypothetical protein